MTPRSEIVRDLTLYGESDPPGLPLWDAAVLIAALGRPALPTARYRRHLDKLVRQVGDYARVGDGAVPVAVMAEALAQVLARHMGYGGGEGAAPDEDAFDVTRVVDSRTGADVALSILYAETARGLGWAAEILEIPGRVLIRLEAAGERLVVDPAGAGRVLEAADLRALAKAFGGIETELRPDGIEVLDDRHALLRLLAGKKSVLLRAKRLEDAAALIDCALLIAPEEPTLWRECGLLNARRDRIREAIEALEAYLRLGAEDAARYNTTLLLQELRGRLS